MSVVILKATLALLIALGAAMMFRRAAAATRHAILVAGQLAALTVPLLAFVVPRVNVEYAPADFGVRPQQAPLSYEVRAEAAPSAPHHEPRNILPILWFLGFASIASKRIASFVRARALVRRATRHGNILLSDDVDQPVTLGSRIVLPSSAVDWDDDRLRAVLLHERAHVTRHDFLQAAIGDLACAVYWFHPLVWLAARQAVLAREQACDDAVLANGVTPDAYAATLLDVARSLVRRRAAPGLAMAARSQLEVRLRAILDDDRVHRATRTSRIGVIVIAIACAPLLAAITPRGNEPDLRGDFIASPYSEHIPFETIPNVPATGPDAALIARMHELARRPKHSKIDFVADRARWALSRVDNGELFAPLLTSLQDPDWRIRAYAAFGLAVAGERRATPSLLPLMNESNWRVRAMTASALRHIADPAAAPTMRRALADEAWQVRFEAVHYFDAIGAEPALFESMIDDRHMAVRTAVTEALQ